MELVSAAAAQLHLPSAIWTESNLQLEKTAEPKIVDLKSWAIMQKLLAVYGKGFGKEFSLINEVEFISESPRSGAKI